MYTFNQFYIPERMMGGIKRYVEDGVLPGDFLQGVICNDLHKAVAHADDENLANLPAFSMYMYNRAPAACRGSKEKMDAWVKLKRDLGNSGLALSYMHSMTQHPTASESGELGTNGAQSPNLN
jgi:hypothetical protein